MRARGALWAVLLLCCGPAAPEGTGGFQFSMLLQGAVAPDVGELQVAMLKAGQVASAKPPGGCAVLAGDCLNAEGLAAAAFVRLFDPEGNAHQGVRLPATTDLPTGQTLHVTAEVGTDYLVVIEALTRDQTPRLIGTSCRALPGGVQESGTQIVANPLTVYSPYLACDARLP